MVENNTKENELQSYVSWTRELLIILTMCLLWTCKVVNMWHNFLPFLESLSPGWGEHENMNEWIWEWDDESKTVKAFSYTHLIFLLIIQDFVLAVEILYGLPGVLRLILIAWSNILFKSSCTDMRQDVRAYPSTWQDTPSSPSWLFFPGVSPPRRPRHQILHRTLCGF